MEKICLVCRKKYNARLKNQKFCSGLCKNKDWYKYNQLKKINYQKKYLKDNNYASEKTINQRKMRSIKRRTRNLYPLEGHRCEFCSNKATEHHHNTFPIEIDKFNYICHRCHLIKNKLMKEVNK